MNYSPRYSFALLHLLLTASAEPYLIPQVINHIHPIPYPKNELSMRENKINGSFLREKIDLEEKKGGIENCLVFGI